MDDAEFYLYHNQLLEQKTCKAELKKLIGKTSSSDRFLDFETLVKYKVGIGKEEFVTPNGTLQKVPVVYFPMFKYSNHKSAEDSSNSSSTTASEDEDPQNGLLQHENLESQTQKGTEISTPTCKLVKSKVRGIGKENKKYMRMMPAGSGR